MTEIFKEYADSKHNPRLQKRHEDGSPSAVPGYMHYFLKCKECGTETKLQAKDFFDAGEKFVTLGWRYDRLYDGYLCGKCSI